MLSYKFEFEDVLKLKEKMNEKIRSFEIVFDQSPAPRLVKINYDNSSPIFIKCEMKDVKERFEIGVLLVSDKYIKFHDIKNIIKKYDNPISVKICSKILYRDDSVVADCGLRLELENGDDIHILPGDYPFSVALIGKGFDDLKLVPEFPLDRYSYEIL